MRMYGSDFPVHELQKRESNIQGMVTVQLFVPCVILPYVRSSIDKHGNRRLGQPRLRLLHLRTPAARLLSDRNIGTPIEQQVTYSGNLARLRTSSRPYI